MKFEEWVLSISFLDWLLKHLHIIFSVTCILPKLRIYSIDHYLCRMRDKKALQESDSCCGSDSNLLQNKSSIVLNERARGLECEQTRSRDTSRRRFICRDHPLPPIGVKSRLSLTKPDLYRVQNTRTRQWLAHWLAGARFQMLGYRFTWYSHCRWVAKTAMPTALFFYDDWIH